jgi:hypothetical protein
MWKSAKVETKDVWRQVKAGEPDMKMRKTR